MSQQIKAPRGTADILPSEIHKVQYIEQTCLDVAGCRGFREIRVPVFEHTELFNRGVGETTDVVQKEMYTFNDNGGRSITLRPEGTAGTVRAYIEHGLFNEPSPQKLCYLTSCYRYEKPQAGRLREFHQFGIECIGAGTPQADAEIICVANGIFEQLGVKNLHLEINSIGCPVCRKEYHKALQEYFESKKSELCETCLGRLDRNPMRILDCKSPVCKEIAAGAPVVLDFLCDECKEHFEQTKKFLTAAGLDFTVNPTIVRGLDYYTKTVFEFVSDAIGAQGTVCGGGRYDGLVEQLGGNSVPAAGFGMGIERLKLVMEAQGCLFPKAEKCSVYIGSMDEQSTLTAFRLCEELRAEGISAQCDVVGRSVKAQMKFANKIEAMYVVMLGSGEIESGIAKIKNMESGDEQEIALEGFTTAISNMIIGDMLDDIADDGFDLSSLI